MTRFRKLKHQRFFSAGITSDRRQQKLRESIYEEGVPLPSKTKERQELKREYLIV
jgi:hypothetical protein